MALNKVFSSAVNYERRARWKQVVKKYKEMFALLRERNSDDKIDENSLKMLLYECHFHCGVAYHHLDQLTDATTHFMSAMRVISRKKINCCVGCITGKVLHFHVPVLAKISICHIQQGEYETALKKVEEALVLDFKNPDLFCIRACAYYLLKNKTGAMQDVNFAIWLRPKHVCAWLLRGIFKEKQKDERSQNDGKNTDLEMACSLESSISAYATAKNFSSSVHHILNRYLPSLRVSHTITANDVFREHNSEPQLNVSNKSRTPFRPRESSTREHRCKSHEKEIQKKKMEKPRNGKEETAILTFTASSLSVIPSLSRMLMIREDNNLKMRARSEPALNKMADIHLLRTVTQASLSRERAMTNMSLKDRRKTPFPANGIKVKDLLNVNVRAEHPQGDDIRRVERSLGTPQIGRMTSFPVTHKGSLYFPCRTFKDVDAKSVSRANTRHQRLSINSRLGKQIK